MREEHASDFFVDVADIGRFRFARRTIRDTFRIRSVYARLTEGNYDAEGNAADVVAFSFAQVQVLLVASPDGFDLEKMDPLVDPDWEVKILNVFKALRDKELSFRPQSAGTVQAESAEPEVNVPAGLPQAV